MRKSPYVSADKGLAAGDASRRRESLSILNSFISRVLFLSIHDANVDVFDVETPNTGLQTSRNNIF